EQGPRPLSAGRERRESARRSCHRRRWRPGPRRLPGPHRRRHRRVNGRRCRGGGRHGPARRCRPVVARLCLLRLVRVLCRAGRRLHTRGRRPAGTHQMTDAAPQQPRPRRGSSAALLLVGVVTILVIGGLVMVLSASSVEALRLYGNSWLFFQRQLLWVALGIAAMLLTIRIDYRRWRRFAVPMLLVSGGLLVLVIVPGLGISALALGLHASYRRARLLSFLNPWKDAANTGYQSVQSLVGLGTGQLTGVGLGASRAKWGFLPNAHTDFIFAIIGEELGLMGSLLVVVLFAAFAVLGVRAAVRAPDRFGSLLAVGITAWIVGQAVLNIGTVIGLLPVTGVPLPLVSFGGSSLVITMAAIGVLVNVTRHGRA